MESRAVASIHRPGLSIFQAVVNNRPDLLIVFARHLAHLGAEFSHLGTELALFLAESPHLGVEIFHTGPDFGFNHAALNFPNLAL
jgi:hypothetical protein